MAEKNVSKPNKPKQGTRLRNFIASGGNPKDYETCKGLEKAGGKKDKNY